MISVRYFAAARERAGVSSEQLDASGLRTVGDAIDRLVARHPALGPLRPHLRFALDQELVDGATPLKDGAELALIPPVSGGSGAPDTHLALDVLDTPLSLDAVVGLVSDPSRGGVVTFSGAVRNHTRGKPVVRLEYEAYRPMTLKVLSQIRDEAAQRWPGSQLAIHHRVGILPPGELAVVIAASAPHRAEAFDACRYAIEQLKHRAPIWKKEVFEDGEAWVGLGP